MHPTFSAAAGYLATLFGGGLVVAVPTWRRSRARKRAVEYRLLGKAAVTDKNGVEITPKISSVHEEIDDLRKSLLARPALNGQFTLLVQDVKEMRDWQRAHDQKHESA